MKWIRTGPLNLRTMITRFIRSRKLTKLRKKKKKKTKIMDIVGMGDMVAMVDTEEVSIITRKRQSMKLFGEILIHIS